MVQALINNPQDFVMFRNDLKGKKTKEDLRIKLLTSLVKLKIIFHIYFQ